MNPRLVDLYIGIFNRLVDFWLNMKSVYLWNHEARADDYFCAKRHLIGRHKEYTCLGWEVLIDERQPIIFRRQIQNLLQGKIDAKCRLPNLKLSSNILKVNKNILNFKALDNGKTCGKDVANGMVTIEKMKIHHLIRWEYEVYKSTWVGFEIIESYAYHTQFFLIFTVFLDFLGT